MVPSVSRSGRRLALISIASLGWAFSFGLGAPLAALWLKQAGASGWAIGLNTSVYYLGVALAAPLLPRLMRRHNRACIVAGMLIDALTTAAFPWVSGDLAWHGLRFVGGIGTALSLIPMETLVNHNAPPERRARDFGVYAFCVALGIGLGSLVGLLLYPIAPHLAFAVGGLVTLGAIMPAWLEAPSTCRHEASTGGDALPWRAGLLGFGTAWVQGFLEGGTITFLSIYLLGLGYTEAATSGLMGGLFAGVVLAQLPLACLADRVGRLRVVLICHALVLGGLVCVAVGTVDVVPGRRCCSSSARPTGRCTRWASPCSGERIPPSAMARANAWYLACNCAGSLLGPILIGVAIDAFGMPAHVRRVRVRRGLGASAAGWRWAGAWPGAKRVRRGGRREALRRPQPLVPLGGKDDRHAMPQDPARLLITRLEREHDAEVRGQPDRQRRQRLADGHRVEPGVEQRAALRRLAGPERHRVQVRRGRAEGRVAAAEQGQHVRVQVRLPDADQIDQRHAHALLQQGQPPCRRRPRGCRAGPCSTG